MSYKIFTITRPTIGVAAVILFERHEQKDKSGRPDPIGYRPNKNKSIKCVKGILKPKELFRILVL